MIFCVPVFIIVTGYLMHKKQLSKSYYSKLSGVLLIYLVTSIIYWIYAAATDNTISVGGIFGKIIGGEGSPYSWYIEMYIGLFLFIPFLNAAWINLKTKRSRQILCLTLALVVTGPLVVFKNIHLPDFWIGLWPFMYYYIGAYLNEYRPKISGGARLGLLVISWGLLCTAAIFQIAQNNHIIPTNLTDLSYPWIMLYSVAIFIATLGITTRPPRIISKLIISISSHTLGTYLISAIFDEIIYRKILNFGTTPALDFRHAFYAIPIIFIASYISAIIISTILKIILRVINAAQKNT